MLTTYIDQSIQRNRMKKLITLIILLAAGVAAIKYVEPVKDWARETLPEDVLTLIGEEPKGLFEKGADAISEGLEKGSEIVEDLVDKVKN